MVALSPTACAGTKPGAASGHRSAALAAFELGLGVQLAGRGRRGVRRGRGGASSESGEKNGGDGATDDLGHEKTPDRPYGVLVSPLPQTWRDRGTGLGLPETCEEFPTRRRFNRKFLRVAANKA
jgi:hypothetical protein